MVDFQKAIMKPFSNVTAFVIGIIIGIIPIVSILVGGYVLKVAEDTTKGKHELRSWAVNDVVDYIVKIIVGIVISIVYMIIPVIVLVAGVGSAIITALTSSATTGGISDPTAFLTMITQSLSAGAPLIILGVILVIIAAILLPMAMLKWLKSGKIGAAFNIGAVVKNVLTVDYWVALIVGLIYGGIVMAVLGAIAAFLMIIPVAGWIIGMLILSAASFMTSVTMYSLLGQTVKN